MQKFYLFLLICLPMAAMAGGGRTLGDIRKALMEASTRQVQEKVFIHTDNTCYFVGDTIWYKAYVVRADDLYYTDMSRILYVELLTPDGLLVERQRIIVSDQGYSCGNFCLSDSLYSGYYEMRAYTRWMLNFNVSKHRYSKNDSYFFYNNQMASDYFRQWDGLYSRVMPVYSRPDSAGDYTYKRMMSRPKQHVIKTQGKKLNATFYPEGGHLIEGVPNRVAFELTDQEGAAVETTGSITAGGTEVAKTKTVHMGRGTFTVTPGADRLKATFRWGGKEYYFDLPKAEKSGTAITLSDRKLDIYACNLPTDRDYGISILCRGVLRHFQAIAPGTDGHITVELPEQLPTGVNDVTLFDNDGRILADRLFFVNNHDYDNCTMTVNDAVKTDYRPYEQISLDMRCNGISEPTLFSVAVRDARTDDDTYDDGNIMTDLLLSSELKGFVANPAYYFAADDDTHTRALDLLMMVQGWRKYKWQELSDTLYMERRYKPETSLTVEGCVYKMLSLDPAEPDEIASWQKGVGKTGNKTDGETNAAAADETGITDGGGTDGMTADDVRESVSVIEYGNIGDANASLGVNHGQLKREVTVEAEVTLTDGVVGSSQLTHNGGRFIFEVPPFYGNAVLKMKAYNEKDSLKKNMTTGSSKHLLDETAFPDFFVKRDMFFPVFTDKYSYYQTHAPEIRTSLDIAGDSLSAMETDDHLLQNLDVKGKKRGKRAIDFNRPAYVTDAYEIYNDMTDYGLGIGMFDMRQFPVQVARFLYGNMGRYNRFNVDGRIDRFTYYRNYKPDENDFDKVRDNRNARALYDKLMLKSLHQVRVFSDYEPRNEDAPMVHDMLNADVTVEMVPFGDGGKQHTFRDRHIVLHGFNEPDDFYCPDYSNRQPTAPADYRRTLYWNPNAKTDAEGRFSTTIYNNGNETRIKISAAGIAPDGRLIRME